MVFKEIKRFHDGGVIFGMMKELMPVKMAEAIAKAIIDCAVFVVFITPKSTDSINCRNEINLALNGEKLSSLSTWKKPNYLRPPSRMGDLQAIFRYNIPVDRYERKSQGALYQLLGTSHPETNQRMFGTSLSPKLLDQMVDSGDMPSLGGEGSTLPRFLAMSNITISPIP